MAMPRVGHYAIARTLKSEARKTEYLQPSMSNLLYDMTRLQAISIGTWASVSLGIYESFCTWCTTCTVRIGYIND